MALLRNLQSCAHGIQCGESRFPVLKGGHGNASVDGVESPEHLEFHFHVLYFIYVCNQLIVFFILVFPHVVQVEMNML